MFEIAQDLGAYAVYLSGAGPTIMAVVNRENEEFFTKAEELLQQQPATMAFSLRRMLADNVGAVVE